MGGFSLLEMLLVLALIGILAGMANWGGRHLLMSWQAYRAGHQLLEDLKGVQGKAEMSASLAMSDGYLVQQVRFLVFDEATSHYAAFLWRDLDQDGYTEAEEVEELWQKDLPPGVVFGWSPGITRRACSNAPGEPGAAITFASPGYQPCNNRPCIKFNHDGFSVLGPGALYVHAGAQSMAITGTRPGHFTLCEWDGTRWH